MEDIVLLNAIERYINGEMPAEEQMHFETMRQQNAELDQLVVEHLFFQKQLDQYNDRRQFKAAMNTIHDNLVKEHQISIDTPKQPGKVISLWHKYKRNIAVAASIAGIVTIAAVSLIMAYSKRGNNNDIINLRSEFDRKLNKLNDKLEKNTKNTPITTANYGGTGFLVDGKGIIVTNQHVVGNRSEVYVFNEKFGNMKAKVLKTDASNDLALLQIIDTVAFKPFRHLPYSIRKTEPDLGQNVYTLGYPRPELIYNEGYVSSRTATGVSKNPANFFLSIRADEGNSGSPIFNQRGEIQGVINAKERNPNGFALGIKTHALLTLLDELKQDKLTSNALIGNKSSLSGAARPDQVKKLAEYVFMMEIE
jgi:serine protease Do